MVHRYPSEDPKPLSAKFPRYSAWTLLRTMAALALGYILLLAYLHYQGDAHIRRIFGGPQGVSALNHADQMEAFRIEALPERNTSSNALEDFPIIKGPVA